MKDESRSPANRLRAVSKEPQLSFGDDLIRQTWELER
jgi:hypothetical protein